MYYIAEAIHTEKAPELADEFMPQHVAYVNAAIDRGLVMLGGPKAAGKGGFLIISSDSEEEVQDFLRNDPMVTCGGQNYVLQGWNIFDKAESLQSIF